MLERIQLLRNVGPFDSVAPGAQLPLAKLNLIYAENSRGKTTLAAIFTSLGTGEAAGVTERHRLGAPHPPHVIFRFMGGALHTFENGAWSAALPTVVVFDDRFVSENICSGIEVRADQRQNLHELILGAQGVTLNDALQAHVAAIEQHNRQLRQREEAIPAAAHQGLNADEFCSLPVDHDIAAHILEAERGLAAARSVAEIRAQPEFAPIELSRFDLDTINELLGRDLPQLNAAAAARVQTHLAHIGDIGERWVGEGVNLIASASRGHQAEICPFCAQPLAGSNLIDHYRAYFGAEYAALKVQLDEAHLMLTRTHGADAPAAFERAVRVAGERREFWARFVNVPEVAIDTAEISRIRNLARDSVLLTLRAKQAAPLERRTLDAPTLAALESYRQARERIAALSDSLIAANPAIAAVKERAQATNVAALTADLARLRAVESRHSVAISALCQSYLEEKAAKIATEGLRTQARTALDNYRQNVFPAYQAAINTYLQRFNAPFRLSRVSPVNTRAGSAATYSVVINEQEVELTAEAGPSFRNTLSAGDRNSLALAFFFASLDRDGQLANKIVVIDDPMTSLDENRALVTIQEIRRLLDRVSQVIVLSHSKPFLMALWKDSPANNRTAIRIGRAAAGSEITAWNVTQDSVTEHDRRYARVLSYLAAADPDIERLVASDLRPMLEAFIRVAYPGEFPPESLLGPFANLCEEHLGSVNEILSAVDTAELEALLEFANRYHHDTNPTWQTENINDAELANFAERTLRFIRRT